MSFLDGYKTYIVVAVFMLGVIAEVFLGLDVPGVRTRRELGGIYHGGARPRGAAQWCCENPVRPMPWLRLLLRIAAAVCAIAGLIAQRRSQHAGRVEAEKRQLEADHDALRKAIAARRSVDHADGCVQRDSRNRDAS